MFLLTRDDVKSLLSEMERSPSTPPRALAKAEAPLAALVTPSPLDRPGRLEEDRLLGEVTIGLLSEDEGSPERAVGRLEAMLSRIEAKRRFGPRLTDPRDVGETIRVRLGEQLWKAGRLAEARRLWDDVFAPLRQLAADDRGRQAIQSRFAGATQRIGELYFDHGLWEQAAEYDGYYRAGHPEGRLLHCYDSGLLALCAATSRPIARS